MNLDFLICLMGCLIDHWFSGLVLVGLASIGAYKVVKVSVVVIKSIKDMF